MFLYVRRIVFSLVAVIALAAPQLSSAAVCGSLGGSSSTYGGTSIGGSIGVSSSDTCPPMGGIFGGFSQFGLSNPFGLPGGSVFGIVANIVNWLLALFGILGILGFIISGIMYLISAGDDDMAKKAKAGLKYSIIGIIVGLSGFIVLQAIAGLLSGVGGNY